MYIYRLYIFCSIYIYSTIKGFGLFRLQIQNTGEMGWLTEIKALQNKSTETFLTYIQLMFVC